MKFLHEEFFGKVYKYIQGINIFIIRVLAKILFWGILFGFLGLLAWLYYLGKIQLAFWIVGILFAAEIAHYLRKSMERRLSMKQEESSNIQDQLVKSDIIKTAKKKSIVKKKVVNESGLLKKKKVVVKKKVVNKDGLLNKK
jgi:hypothetical protein